MKKFIILFLIVLCSFVLADTGDWESAITLVSNQPGNDETDHHGINWIVSSYVDINGIHVFYDDGTTQSGGGYWKVVTFDMDGDVLYTTNVTPDIIDESHIDGNDDAIFVVWVDPFDSSGTDYGRISAKISTNGGANWSDTYSHTLPPIINRVFDLSVDCDDDGIHVLTKIDINRYGVEYLFLPNDADADNDWIHTGEAPGNNYYAYITDCDDNGFAIEAINDYGTSSYDNIFIGYMTNGFKLEGAISVDDGSNWNEKDYMDESNRWQKTFGMDMAFDGDDDFFCATMAEGSSIDSIIYYHRPAKGTSSYSGTWSSPTYITATSEDIMVTSLLDINTNGNGYVDLVYVTYGDGESGIYYRKMSTSSSGTEETVDFFSGGPCKFYYPDVTKSNDVFVVWRSSVKNNTADIKMTYRDATPITPTIAKDWSGTNPKITWTKPCLDTEEYQVWRKIDSGSYTLRATTSNLYFVENQYYFYRRGSHSLRYKVKAVDYDDNISAYSNEVYYSHMEEASKIVGEFRPTEYALHNAYPNPFNPTTTITFDIPESGYANLSVYNSLGQKVLDLVEGSVEVGRHQVQVDGSNLSSGIYFIKMTTATFNKMQKIVLMK